MSGGGSSSADLALEKLHSTANAVLAVERPSSSSDAKETSRLMVSDVEPALEQGDTEHNIGRKYCCGELDGQEILGLRTQWAVVGLIFLLVVWQAIDDADHPLLTTATGMTQTQAFYLLDVAMPVVLIILGFGLMFVSFGGSLPDKKILIMVFVYGGLTAFWYALDAIVPWIVASSAAGEYLCLVPTFPFAFALTIAGFRRRQLAAVVPFYLIVQILSSKPGEGATYNYGLYTFLAPTGVATYRWTEPELANFSRRGCSGAFLFLFVRRSLTHFWTSLLVTSCSVLSFVLAREMGLSTATRWKVSFTTRTYY